MPEDVSARTPMLEMRNVSKTFPGVKALNAVQLRAWAGEVLALMGENGAGKSTLMKILSGAYQPDSGAEILIDGQPVAITDPIAAKRHGIAIICDRVLVMREGHMQGEVGGATGQAISQENIMTYAAGAAA